MGFEIRFRAFPAPVTLSATLPFEYYTYLVHIDDEQSKEEEGYAAPRICKSGPFHAF